LDGDILWGLFKVVIALGILIPVLIYVTRWYAKRQIVGQSAAVKEIIPLGANKALYVVEWEGEKMLLGVTAQSITVLEQKQITPKIETEEAAT